MYYFTDSNHIGWYRLSAKTLHGAKIEATRVAGYIEPKIKIVETKETNIIDARLDELTPVAERIFGKWRTL